ncbi:hypothetical protein [Salinispora arenicola]|uniref:hypothetical protein n=2 Tax=Salinispora arenicola TaxID=168697 RepID=UPI0003745915|nr:hypothetical protein [Salinispora arenicola]
MPGEFGLQPHAVPEENFSASKVIVPAGFSLGPQHRYVRPADPTPESWEVHLGGDILELSEAEVGVYGTAFLHIEDHSQLKVNRARLIQELRTAPHPQPDAQRLVDRLIDRGLLLEFDPEGPLEELFRRYRLFPTAEGMGSTPEEPEYHRMGHGNRPLVAVHNDAYVMWAFSFLHANLWEACAYFAKADQEELEEGEQPIGLTADRVAREVAVNLPMMIATQCAFLDPAAAL